jgi:hypothetical protein
MELLTGILAAFGLSASAGLNAYIPLFIIGAVAHYFPRAVTLNQPFDLIANPWVLIVLGVLVIVEFLADKVPAINHVNDIIQTVIRPVAGAIVFAASAKVITDVSPILALVCGLLVAGSVHVVKAAAVRPAVTATTGGAGNVPVSLAEDFLATIVSILSVVIPILAGIFLLLLIGLIIWWVVRRAQQRKAAGA